MQRSGQLVKVKLALGAQRAAGHCGDKYSDRGKESKAAHKFAFNMESKTGERFTK